MLFIKDKKPKLNTQSDHSYSRDWLWNLASFKTITKVLQFMLKVLLSTMIWLNQGKTIYLIYTLHIPHCIFKHMQQDFNKHFIIEGAYKNLTFGDTNWKMMSESSKRHSKPLSLIFILNCLSKTSVIGALFTSLKSDKNFPSPICNWDNLFSIIPSLKVKEEFRWLFSIFNHLALDLKIAPLPFSS